MGCSDGEAMSAPQLGPSGGHRACHGGDAGSASIPPRRGIRRRGLSFETTCLIGQGSAALVYLVRCKRTGTMSALKVQRKADHLRSVERVHAERDIMVHARHQLVARLLSAFQDPLYLYLQMEYCPGGSLDIFVRQIVRRRLTEDETRFYAAEIVLGLEFLHSKGFVYKDLKAANVLVADSGHIKLTDFGIAERGDIRMATEKVDRPAISARRKSLPRTQSTPRLGDAHTERSSSGAPRVVQEAMRSPERLSTSSLGELARRLGSLESTRVHLKNSPRRMGFHRRSSSLDGTPPVMNCTSGGGGAPLVPAAASPARGSSLPWNCWKQVEEAPSPTASPAARVAAPRLPSLRLRFRERFLRSVRASTEATTPRSISYTELSSLPVEQGGSGSNESGGRMRGAAKTRSHSKRDEALSPRRRVSLGGEVVLPTGVTEKCSPTHQLPERLESPGRCSRTARKQATVVLSEASWYRMSGSPEYMAPEVLMHTAQGSALDWWGLGILTYELLVERTPFAGEKGKTRQTYLNIMHKEVEFPDPKDSTGFDISEDCRNFVQALLMKDPNNRAGCRGSEMVKEHPFFSGICWDKLLAQQPPLVPCLRQYNANYPISVENTSGWSWAAEDAETEVRDVFGTQANEVENSPFDSFDWRDPSQEEACSSDRGTLSVPERQIAATATGRSMRLAVGVGPMVASENTLRAQGLRAPAC